MEQPRSQAKLTMGDSFKGLGIIGMIATHAYFYLERISCRLLSLTSYFLSSMLPVPKPWSG